MKISTYKQHKFTADLWTFSITRDSTGGEIRNYAFARNLHLRATTSAAGRLFVFFKPTDSDVVDRCQLSNFRDVNGNEIRVNGVWTVLQMQPQLNLWGTAEGFRGIAEFTGTDQPG